MLDLCSSSSFLFVLSVYQSKNLILWCAGLCSPNDSLLSSVWLHASMYPSVHTSARLCFSEPGMCGSVCVCVWKCGWLWSEWERGTTREGERKRERKMREVWELNGQTRCPDVLGHAVSLASFCHSTGFFKFWVEVLAAALHIRFKRHMFFLTSSVVSKGNVCMRVEYNLQL